MKIINPKIGNLENVIQPINDVTIRRLALLALQIKKDMEVAEIRDKIYTSRYNASNLERKELELEEFLQQISNANIRTQNQNKEYKWVKINTNNMGDINYRFYLAPNPEHMHEIVKKLVESFSVRNIPVRFKYQLTTNMEYCDRIIIYSDFNNKGLVEQAINAVYQSSPELFRDCESSIAWLYNSKTPGVYFAPETSGDAYGNRLADVILTAKETFDFLYGITNSTGIVELSGNEANNAIEYMEMLIGSIMLRKGILLSKDGRCINIIDTNIKTKYNYDNGILENSNFDSRGYFQVDFYPTPEGREALLNNFYSVSTIRPQKGLDVKYLTPEQKREEVNKNLYPYKYSVTPLQNSSAQNGRKMK